MAASRSLTLRRLISRTTLSHLTNHFNPIHAPPLLISNPSDRFKSPFNAFNPSRNLSISYGSVNLVFSGVRPRFVMTEVEETRKQKCQRKKRLSEKRRRERRELGEATHLDPRRLRPLRRKIKRSPAAIEHRLKHKIAMAKRREAWLVERLKKYEVRKLQGPMPKPDELTCEERLNIENTGQMQSNYAPVGRRGVFGGVILNMHMHWKRHETVKIICKHCKPGQIHEYARDIARLSGGIPIQIVGNKTIMFYRGKNYVPPEPDALWPIDTLSKKKALEKSKYEQTLETVRHVLAVTKKELQLYYRHVALYGDLNSHNSSLVCGDNERKPWDVETGTSASKKGGQ